MSRGTTARNVRIDDERWADLGVIARARGKDRSTLIRDMIDVLREGLGDEVMTPTAHSEQR